MNMQMMRVDAAPDSDVLKQLLDADVLKALGLKKDDLDVGLKLAGIKVRSGNYEEAMKLYSSLLMFNPCDFRIYKGLASLCLETGDHDEALHFTSVMIALKPMDPLGYYLSARACLLLGHLDEAREDLADAMARIGDGGDARLLEGCRKLTLLLVPAK
ncbi:hypothetical protein OA90_26390 [Labrenzia sp. OB1]|nr:hypothetical protein OA90_26390 [Labrenzia sp. OB1]